MVDHMPRVPPTSPLLTQRPRCAPSRLPSLFQARPRPLAVLALLLGVVQLGTTADSGLSAPAAPVPAIHPAPLPLAAAAPPTPPTPSAPGQPAPFPIISFEPAVVQLTHRLQARKGDAAATAPDGSALANNWSQFDNFLAIGMDAVADDGWELINAENAIVLEATTSAGETLAVVTGDASLDGIGYQHNPIDGREDYNRSFAIYLTAPKRPATSLKKLVVTADLTFASRLGLLSKTFALAGKSDPAKGPPGCDLAVGMDAKGEVLLTYHEHDTNLDAIRSISCFDDDGQLVKPESRASDASNGQNQVTLVFPRKHIAQVTVTVFPVLRKLQATVELHNLPLIGKPSESDAAGHPTATVHEIPYKVDAEAGEDGKGPDPQ